MTTVKASFSTRLMSLTDYVRKLFLLSVFSFCLLACGKTPKSSSINSTNHDSTLYYYNLGWKQIMDDGFYGPAETTYRKALAFDNAVYADVYFQIYSLNLAKTHADRAVILDPRNLDASRLKSKIDKAINKIE